MKVGIGVDINSYDEVLLNELDIINIENPLYPRYLYDNKEYGKVSFKNEVIVDGAYIDINPAVEEPDLLEIVVDRVTKSIEFAKHYGASEIIFLSTFIPDIKVEAYDDKWLNNSIRFWKEICSKNREIRISICNTFERSPEILVNLVKGVNMENFKMAMDIGHVLIYSEIGIDEWYDKVKSFVNTLYIHSNNRIGDEHLGLNKGKLLENKGFQRIVGELRNKKIILKVFNKSDVEPSIKILRDLIS